MIPGVIFKGTVKLKSNEDIFAGPEKLLKTLK